MAKVQVASIYEYFKGGNFIVLGKTNAGEIAMIHEDYKNKPNVLLRHETELEHTIGENKVPMYQYIGTSKESHSDMFKDFLNKKFFYGIKMDGTGVEKLKLIKGTYMQIIE